MEQQSHRRNDVKECLLQINIIFIQQLTIKSLQYHTSRAKLDKIKLNSKVVPVKAVAIFSLLHLDTNICSGEAMGFDALLVQDHTFMHGESWETGIFRKFKAEELQKGAYKLPVKADHLHKGALILQV